MGKTTSLSSRSSSQAPCESDNGRKVTARFKALRTLSYRASALSDCVQNVKLFQDCSDDFRTMIQESVNVKVFQAGMEIFRQGEYGEEMYILANGSVEVLANSVCVATLEAGSIFGEMAVLSKNLALAKRTATVQAKGDCVCRVIHRDDLNNILRRFPKDKAVLDAEAQRRREGLEAMGILPKKAEWWRPVAPRQDQEGEVRGAQQLWRSARRLSLGAVALGAVAEQKQHPSPPARRSSDAGVVSGRAEVPDRPPARRSSDAGVVSGRAEVEISLEHQPHVYQPDLARVPAVATPRSPHSQEDMVLPPIQPPSRTSFPTHMLEAALSGAEVSQTCPRDTKVAIVGEASRKVSRPTSFARFRRRSL